MTVDTLELGHDCHAPGTLTAHAARLLARLRLAAQVWRERRELAELPPELLQDIGVHPGDAAREARRSWFDLPSRRR